MTCTFQLFPLSSIRLSNNKGKEHFEVMLRQVFQCMKVMMGEPAERLMLIQELCLKYLPSIIADVITVFDPQEFR